MFSVTAGVIAGIGVIMILTSGLVIMALIAGGQQDEHEGRK